MNKKNNPLKTIKMFKDGRWIRWDGSEVQDLLIEEQITLKELKKRHPMRIFKSGKNKPLVEMGKEVIAYCKGCKTYRLIINGICPGCGKEGNLIFEYLENFNPLKEMAKL